MNGKNGERRKITNISGKNEVRYKKFTIVPRDLRRNIYVIIQNQYLYYQTVILLKTIYQVNKNWNLEPKPKIKTNKMTTDNIIIQLSEYLE